MNIYQVCVLTALLYGSTVKLGPPTWDRNAAWTQFHLRRLKHIFGVKCHYHIPSSEILSLVSPACTPYSVRSTWDGSEFVAWMMDTSRRNNTDNWQQESRKSDAPLCGSWTLANVTSKCAKLIQTIQLEDAASYRNRWRSDEQWKKESRNQSRRETSPESWKEARLLQKRLYFALLQNFICAVCRRHCHSRIGLHSFTRRCSTTTDWLERTIFVPRDPAFQL